MTLPDKEKAPGFETGAGESNDAASTPFTYSKLTQSATPDAITTAWACGSCLAFNAWDNGQGECRRYAPRPNESTPMFGEWPRVGSSDYCMEFTPKMGGE